VLRELWRWREAEAIAANKPPFFVMSHDAIVGIAGAATASQPIEPFFPRHISDRRRGGVANAVAAGLALAADRHPKVIRNFSRRTTEGERRRFAELQKRRDAHATRLGIDPTLIASRGILSDLAHNWEKYQAELMNWQKALLAD
jgi:ribonuclease D